MSASRHGRIARLVSVFAILVSSLVAGGVYAAASASAQISCGSFSSPTDLPKTPPLVPYSDQLTVSGGTAPYSFVHAAYLMPPGLKLSSSGLISGNATNVGNYRFGVKVTDAVGCSAWFYYTLLVTTGNASLDGTVAWVQNSGSVGQLVACVGGYANQLLNGGPPDTDCIGALPPL